MYLKEIIFSVLYMVLFVQLTLYSGTFCCLNILATIYIIYHLVNYHLTSLIKAFARLKIQNMMFDYRFQNLLKKIEEIEKKFPIYIKCDASRTCENTLLEKT